jgi:hypothetical protein
MNGLFVLAQAGTTVDPNAIGMSITSLIGSLGAAGAAVAVTYYFLGFLRNEGQKQDRIFSEFRDYHAESQFQFRRFGSGSRAGRRWKIAAAARS